ncbi:MAG: hypothetical protein HUU50_04400, partial [Candidatus Brocadiae bacterium]|nr:hypothetical protein [Candidatus Brocadiia bacterium]
MKFYQRILILLFCFLLYAKSQENYGLFFHISTPLSPDKSLGEDLQRFTSEILSEEKYTLCPVEEIEQILMQYGFWKNRFKSNLNSDLQNALKKKKVDYLLFVGIKRNPDHFLLQGRILPVSEEEEESTFIERNKDWQESKTKWADFLKETCLIHKKAETPVVEVPKETPIVETPKETPVVETPKETP